MSVRLGCQICSSNYSLTNSSIPWLCSCGSVSANRRHKGCSRWGVDETFVRTSAGYWSDTDVSDLIKSLSCCSVHPVVWCVSCCVSLYKYIFLGGACRTPHIFSFEKFCHNLKCGGLGILKISVVPINRSVVLSPFCPQLLEDHRLVPALVSVFVSGHLCQLAPIPVLLMLLQYVSSAHPH